MNNWQQNWEIIKQLTLTDFKLRYSGSVLGYMWSLLKPLGLFLVLYFVFGVALRFDSEIKHFPIYLLIGIMLFGFFSEVTTNGLQAVVGRAALIKKIYFPRIIVVLVSSFNALINLFFNFVILAAFMVYFQIDVFAWDTMLVVPYVVELWLLALGVSLILSTLYVRYRDLAHIWEVLLQMLFYLTPIIYPLSMVPRQYRDMLLINPLAQIIIDFRAIFLAFDYPKLSCYPLSQLIIVVLIFVIGLGLFQTNQKYFAERI
ncbi:ABC transporter permease [Patescibacteria group bacterium]|nr:ABC transporter permease [Patescibacteria group bacterium]